MYFVDRVTLGKQMATSYAHFKSTDSVIICMSEPALMAAISMAIELRAWILPLSYQTINDPRDETQILGAVTASGEFCLNPTVSEYEFESIQQDFFGIVEDRKREAMTLLNRSSTSQQAIDPHVLNGRNVILLDDIMESPLQIAIIQTLLRPLRPNGIYGCIGDTTIDISDRLHVIADSNVVFDIVPNLFDDDHYFERQDEYSPDEKQQLAQNISTYWATN